MIAYSQELNLTKGKTYTLSGYLKTLNVSDAAGGAVLMAAYQDDTSTVIQKTSAPVRGTNDWHRFELTFTLPENASSTNVTIRAALTEATGTAYFDCLQLEEGPIANRYNLVENPDFRYGGSTPDYWTRQGTLTGEDVIVTVNDNPAGLDNRAFRINGAAATNKNISQTINVSGAIGDVFVVSGWAMAQSVPLFPSEENRKFSLEIRVNHSDATNESFTFDFNVDSTAWQYLSGRVVTKKAYNSLSIRFITTITPILLISMVSSSIRKNLAKVSSMTTMATFSQPRTWPDRTPNSCTTITTSKKCSTPQAATSPMNMTTTAT